MDKIHNDPVNGYAAQMNVFFNYLKENFTQIAFLFVVGYYIKTKLFPNNHLGNGKTLASSSNSSSNSSGGIFKSLNSGTSSRDEDMRRVRERQQELAAQRAKEALEKKKEEQKNGEDETKPLKPEVKKVIPKASSAAPAAATA